MSRSWNSEQLELISVDSTGNPKLLQVAVRADAGAGKTTLLVERVRRSSGRKRILCVSFTEKSKTDLADRLRDMPRAEVYTIHGFCKRVIDEFGYLAGLLPYPRILDELTSHAIFERSFERVMRSLPRKAKLLSSGVMSILGFSNLLEFCKMTILRADPVTGAKVQGSGFSSHALEALRDYSDAVELEYTNWKRKLNAVDYGDLEKLALELLRKDEIADYFREKYSHVFVDEFQDTNHAQCELVNRIHHPKNGLFVVGDVKQSIYRFRGSDVRVFEDFVTGLDHQKFLSTNYRSHPSIIAAVNRVFQDEVPGFRSMKAFREPASPTERVFRVPAEKIAEGIATAVKKALTLGYKPGDVVLLLRRIRGNEKLFEELERKGIRTVLSLPRDLSENEHLSALSSLWIAVHFPALRSPLLHAEAVLGVDPNDVLRVAEELHSLTCAEVLSRFESQWKFQESLGVVWDSFHELVLGAHVSGISPERLSQEFLRTWQGKPPSGLIPRGVQAPEPPSENMSAIRVTTIHSSKGLEYPVVILADLNERRRSVKRVSLLKDHIWVFAPNEEGEVDRSSEIYKVAEQEEKDEAAAESLRLLYVAMTRAEELLFFVDVLNQKGLRTGWSELLYRKLGEHVPVCESDLVVTKTESSIEPSGTRDPIVASRPKYFPVKTAVTKYVHEERQENKAKKSKFDAAVLQRTAEQGTFVHQLLQLEAWGDLWAFAQKENLDLTQFRRWLDTDQGRTFFSINASVKPLRCEKEVSFEWKVEDDVLVGAIDRLLVWPNEVWIVDYKLIQRKGGLSVAELQHQYAPQLTHYASIVKKMTSISTAKLFVIDLLASSGEVCVELSPVGDTL